MEKFRRRTRWLCLWIQCHTMLLVDVSSANSGACQTPSCYAPPWDNSCTENDCGCGNRGIWRALRCHRHNHKFLQPVTAVRGGCWWVWRDAAYLAIKNQQLAAKLSVYHTNPPSTTRLHKNTTALRTHTRTHGHTDTHTHLHTLTLFFTGIIWNKHPVILMSIVNRNRIHVFDKPPS